MYKIYLCFLSLICAFSATAQSYRKDYKEIVADRIIVNFPDETVTAFTKPVKKKIEPNISKNYYWFSAHAIRITQGGYSGKLLNGPYTTVYLNKNLKEQGSFKDGLKEGNWRTWYPNGNLKETVAWKAGIRTGRFFQYDENGILKLSGRYKRNEYEGKISSYVSKDSIEVKDYKAGNQVLEKAETPKTKKGKPIYKKLLPRKRKAEDADTSDKKRDSKKKPDTR